MKTYEIVLKGFDGSTDETDDKIIWFTCPDNMEIKKNNNKSNLITNINEIKNIFGAKLNSKINDGIDFAIEEKKEVKKLFIDYYLCTECDILWQQDDLAKIDEGDSIIRIKSLSRAMCDDRCPKCNKSCSPYKSLDIVSGGS